MRLTVWTSVVAALLALTPAASAAEPDVPALSNAGEGGEIVTVQYYPGGGGGRGRIHVVSATYGGNCGVPRGNVTGHVAGVCNGQRTCPYTVHHRIIGDPRPGCPKDFVVRWICGDGEPRRAGAPPEAGFGSVVVLSCRGGDY